uniref:receptor protein-tyrosine kinase n=1 Tax=Acrobeloides nanus TaxID=290746 RepID=A0A914EGE0_9BILA
MEYLVSKRLVHRDLAARNILLIENRTAKISDFGLCCTCDDATLSYQASLQKKLPMRWLSIEALLHRTFSENSDVWAFGILMHEVFSGGKVPYTTMEADDILEFLKCGKRLGCPENAPDEVYEIMVSCWEENIESRINFSELSTKLRSILLNETQDYGYICGQDSNDSLV